MLDICLLNGCQATEYRHTHTHTLYATYHKAHWTWCSSPLTILVQPLDHLKRWLPRKGSRWRSPTVRDAEVTASAKHLQELANYSIAAKFCILNLYMRYTFSMTCVNVHLTLCRQLRYMLNAGINLIVCTCTIPF